LRQLRSTPPDALDPWAEQASTTEMIPVWRTRFRRPVTTSVLIVADAVTWDCLQQGKPSVIDGHDDR